MTRAHNFTPRQRLDIFEAAGGLCQRCGVKLLAGKWHADHVIPVAIGGESAAKNGEALCLDCHALKTGDDVRRIAKAVRIAKKRAGIKPKTKPMPGSKASRWKRKIDGTVEER